MSETNKVKICGVKKINKMSREVCLSEIARLDGMNKDGCIMGDFSKYKADIQARLASFT